MTVFIGTPKKASSCMSALLIVKLFKMDKVIAQKSYDFVASFFSKDARIQPAASGV